jgi:hypothetical protein
VAARNYYLQSHILLLAATAVAVAGKNLHLRLMMLQEHSMPMLSDYLLLVLPDYSVLMLLDQT